jgi:hypothetical protein
MPDTSNDDFMRQARSDLERQLATSAKLDAMAVDATETGVSIRARVIVGDERLTLTGSGASRTDAYAALLESAPPEILASGRPGEAP